MAKSKKTTVVNVRPCPQHVKDTFKAYCAARNVTMREALIRLMRHAAANNIKLPE